jgi:hypothetical protein
VAHGGTHSGGSLDPGVPEASVRSAVEAHLGSEGWTVLGPGSEGTAVVAVRHGRTLSITVRGYPAFVPGRRDSVEGPVPPPLRARDWFAQAMLEALLVRGAQPDSDIAVAFPDLPAYRGVHDRTRDAFGRLNLLIFFTGADGRVRDH